MFKLETVYLSEDDHLVILDQTLLPNEVKYLKLTEQADIWEAIYQLRVRGAPAIGVAAGIAAYLAAMETPGENFDDFFGSFVQKLDYLNSSRPTAVNLSWALERIKACALQNRNEPVMQIRQILRAEALRIRDEDIEVCRSIGRYGAELLQDGMGILTHCNAGSLATAKYGTALSPIYVAAEEKGYKNIKVYCDETRPLLQGARLTAFELTSAGIDTTVICDNMVSHVLKSGLVQLVLVGCDRVAANGDAANKIGTSGVAVLAKYYNIPFYVCCPTSTIDLGTKTGEDIPIELRNPEEVTQMWFSKPMAPKNAKVFNPAFDVTEHSLITGIITEYGVIHSPYGEAIQEIIKEAER